MTRTFHLVRNGEVVAIGTVYDTEWQLDYPSGAGDYVKTLYLRPGWALVEWQGERASTVFWPKWEDAIHVHGHAGSEIVWFNEKGEPV